MPLPLIQEGDQDHWNSDAGNYLPSTTWDAAVSAMNLASMKTSFGLAGDFWLKNKFDQMPLQKTLSIQDLNEKYNGSGITWTSPQKEITAEMIYKAHQKEEMWANRATMGQGLTGEALNVGAGLIAGMGDPTMVAGGSLIGTALKTSKFLPALLKSETLAGGLARGALEGGTIAAAMEPAQMARDAMYQQDHSLSQSLTNIAMGMAQGAALEGLKYGGRKFGEYVADRWLGRGTPIEDQTRKVEQAAAAMNEGKRPMLDVLDAHADQEKSGLGPRPPGSEHLNYEWQPVNTDQPVTKKYFLGTQLGNDKLHEVANGERGAANADFGTGLYGSDRLASENGYAASDFSQVPGMIHQFETNEAKLFDLDRPLDQAGAKELAAEVEKYSPQIAKDLREGDISARQAYEQMSREAKDGLNKALSAKGYDGLSWVDENSGEKRNGMMMFPDKAENVNVTGEPYQSNPDLKGGLTQEEAKYALQQYASPENDIFHSKEQEEHFEQVAKRIEAGEGNTEDQAYLDETHQRAAQFAKVAMEKGLLSPEDQRVLQEILGGASEGEGPSLKDKKNTGQKLLQAMADCIVEH